MFRMSRTSELGNLIKVIKLSIENNVRKSLEELVEIIN